jgi:hypothetical protein
MTDCTCGLRKKIEYKIKEVDEYAYRYHADEVIELLEDLLK